MVTDVLQKDFPAVFEGEDKAVIATAYAVHQGLPLFQLDLRASSSQIRPHVEYRCAFGEGVDHAEGFV